MSVITGSVTAYLIRDLRGRVVLACWGDDAGDEARAWTKRGYRVEKTDREHLTGS